MTKMGSAGWVCVCNNNNQRKGFFQFETEGLNLGLREGGLEERLHISSRGKKAKGRSS